MLHRCLKLLSIELFLGPLVAISSADEVHTFNYENVLGTSFQLEVTAPARSVALRAEATVLLEIDRLSGILSSYSEESELSVLLNGRATPRKASAELLEMLDASDRWKTLSAGAFNPAVETLTRLWRQCADEDRLPKKDELQRAVRRARAPAWKIDPDARTIVRSGACPVNLNAIAKGYIIDRACRAALDASSEITGLLLDIGGDMRVCGNAAQSIGVADPRVPADNAPLLCSVRLQNAAVATSGNYERGFEINDTHYSHIIDPRDGMPVDEVIGATVVAPRAAEADALATILNVMTPEEGVSLVNRLKDTECLVVNRDGVVLKSTGWDRRSRPAVPVVLVSQNDDAASEETPLEPGDTKDSEPAGAEDAEEPQQPAPEPVICDPWGQAYEMLVDLQISRPGGRRYARPYIAVWIEDAKGKPVRTLALWLGDYRWIGDLRRWYYLHRSNYRLIRAVSRASRPPGRYRILWDGMANDGKLVPNGQYTVFIEAVREHGSYQLIRRQVTLANETFNVELGRNYEISRAALEFREKKAGQ